MFNILTVQQRVAVVLPCCPWHCSTRGGKKVGGKGEWRTEKEEDAVKKDVALATVKLGAGIWL